MLQRAPEGLGVRDLAQELGLHENTIRFHLAGLLEEGAVECRTAANSGPGRPRLVYAASAASSPAGVRNYELLARILAGSVGAGAGEDAPDVAAQAAGAAWGRAQTAGGSRPTRDEADAVGALMALLEEVGFNPQRETAAEAPAEIQLRHCPFLELAREHQEVVCSVHLGLMQGALEGSAAPVAVRELIPFAAPAHCLATLVEADQS